MITVLGSAHGTSVIGEHDGAGGEVSVGIVTSQLLHESGGPAYLGPDVTPRFDTVALEQVAPDRVRTRRVPLGRVVRARSGDTGGDADLGVLVHGLLGEGVAASTRQDGQARRLGEWLRARYPDVPVALLEDGA